jgi:ferrous iron transport protein B
VRPAPCCEQTAQVERAGEPTVALIGNPNVGKSTVFNALTGARQRVGNWPGKTVQVATGRWVIPGGGAVLVDLPGTYSLDPHSPDEQLVRDVLTGPDRPDLVLAVLDAANLARNLYLLGQVLDTGARVVVAVTMLDVAASRGLTVDLPALSRGLGVPVVAVQPRRGRCAEVGPMVAAALDRPLAVACGQKTAEDRYEWVRRVMSSTVHRRGGGSTTRSDRIDRALTSRWFGLPLFLLVMWTVFALTTRLAAPLQAWLSSLVDGPVRTAAGWALAQVGLRGTWFAGLVDGGLISGIGQLLTFVPLMTIMFVLLTLLEDSGYLARATLVADRLLGLVGLPGSAFLPLVVGFGCNVPAIAATRILPHARHRLLTSLLVPFVSCSARLTVYVLLADVFFGSRAGTAIFAMYVLSVALVVLVGLILRRTVFRDLGRTHLLLELPPYRRPTLRVVAGQTWLRLSGFLRTAGGIIVLTVTAVWLMTAIPVGNHSLYQSVSAAAAPVFAPAGFGDWHASGALLTGFVAKEAVVSTLAQTYPPGSDFPQRLRDTVEHSSGGHPGPAVFALMVFLLAYTPCLATVAAQRAEIGLRWTLFGLGAQLVVAWTLAVLVFQVGRFICP